MSKNKDGKKTKNDPQNTKKIDQPGPTKNRVRTLINPAPLKTGLEH